MSDDIVDRLRAYKHGQWVNPDDIEEAAGVIVALRGRVEDVLTSVAALKATVRDWEV